MPLILFEGAPMERDKKADLVRSLTEQASRVTGIAKEAFLVVIHENPLENIGTGGELLPDKLARERG